MDTIDAKAAIASITTRFRTVASSGMNPNFSWNAVVVIAIVCVSIIAVFAFFSYQWTQSPEGSGVVPTSQKKSVSASDINLVIKIYAEKQSQYEILLQNRPLVPNPAVGSGVNSDTTKALGGDALDINTAALDPNQITNPVP